MADQRQSVPASGDGLFELSDREMASSVLGDLDYDHHLRAIAGLLRLHARENKVATDELERLCAKAPDNEGAELRWLDEREHAV